MKLFLRAVGKLFAESDALLEDCIFMSDALADFSDIGAECDALSDEKETLSVRIERMIAENAVTALDQAEYQSKFARLEKQFEAAKEKLDALSETKKIRFAESEEIRRFTAILCTGHTEELEFTENLWNSVVDHVTVCADERPVFAFKNGKEITKTL
ncbi:MAG: hypothetical protein K5753_01845 [Clostridia bacterium]|nr:hypothetical protein [Clostridia bacterium]